MNKPIKVKDIKGTNYYLAYIKKVKREKKWQIYFMYHIKEELKVGYIETENKRLADYLNYLNNIKATGTNIELSFLILTYEEIYDRLI